MADFEEGGDERSQEENIYKVFMQFDYDQNGTISCLDLHKALDALGESISQNDAFRFIAQYDQANTGFIQFNDFKSFVQEKRIAEGGTSDEDLLDAFVAMGGEADGGGSIDADRLIAIIKKDF